MEHDLLTTPEASQLTGLSTQQLARLCREGKIDGIRRGRDWFISRRSLLTYVRRWHPEQAIDQSGQDA